MNQRTLRPIVAVCVTGLIVAAACGGPPQAMMAASATAGEVPLKVTFTNSSQNASRFEWDFGDGAATETRDVDAQVTHQYTIAGSYTVRLTASTSDEPPLSNNVTLTVSVEPGPLSQLLLDATELTMGPAEQHDFSVQALGA